MSATTQQSRPQLFARVQSSRRKSLWGIETMKLAIYFAAPILTTYIMTRPGFLDWSNKYLISSRPEDTSNNQPMEEWLSKYKEEQLRQSLESRRQGSQQASSSALPEPQR